MTSLIIFLPPDATDTAALFDYVLSPDGSTVASHASVPLGLLPAQPDRQTEVVAVVPALALSWHQVLLPQGSLPRTLDGVRGTTRLRAILDGLLEDQLLDEPAQLHLAVQPQPSASAPVWVAACDRAWLKAGLAALAQAGHEVSRIVPEYTPQSLQDAVYVTGDADAPQLVGLLLPPGPVGSAPAAGGRTSVLVCGLSAVSVALLGELPQGVADMPEGQPSAFQIRAEPAAAKLAEELFKRPVMLLQRAQRLLQAAQTPWELAQFDLADASSRRRWTALGKGFSSFARAPQWRAARWALLALVMGNLVGLNAWALHEQSTLQAQRRQIRAVLTDTFPKIPVVVDAPLQMAREVAVLQRASGAQAGTDLESILASFSALAPEEYALTAIDYVANEARLNGPTMPAQEQSGLLTKLQAQGLSASLRGEQWLIGPGGKP